MSFNKLLILLLFLLPLNLFAYLDPGSGSMLFSALIGIVATLFFVFKGIFFKLIDLPAHFRGLSKRERIENKIVIYSEGPQYWGVFKPIVEELSRRAVPCLYLSGKENDPGLSCGLPNIKTRCIGEGNKAFFILNTLEADVLIMTTPGLDVLQIKRSKGVKNYVHITHSAGGVTGYAIFGTDYYDVVLTGGDADTEFIRTIEKVRDLKPKKIIEVGCAYLDSTREKLASIETAKPVDGRKRVLLSPTWGIHGLLKKCGVELISRLVESDRFEITVRPHPQAQISEKDLLDELQKKFPESSYFHWDFSPDNLPALANADIMISDFSGIIFDYTLLFKRPVIALVSSYDRRGRDASDYPKDPWNIDFLKRYGHIIEKSDIPNIVEIIDNSLDEGISDEIYEYVKNSMDKYPGESGRRSVDVILELIAPKQP